MYTPGINAAFHDSTACLVKDGYLVTPVEEEHFIHIKHGKRPISFSIHELPYCDIAYCLKEGGDTPKNVHLICQVESASFPPTFSDAAISVLVSKAEMGATSYYIDDGNGLSNSIEVKTPYFLEPVCEIVIEYPVVTPALLSNPLNKEKFESMIQLKGDDEYMHEPLWLIAWGVKLRGQHIGKLSLLLYKNYSVLYLGKTHLTFIFLIIWMLLNGWFVAKGVLRKFIEKEHIAEIVTISLFVSFFSVFRCI